MDKIEKAGERADRALAWYERLKDVSAALGIDGHLKAALVALWGLLLGLILWLYDNLPWWGLMAVALVLAILISKAVEAVMRAWAVRGLRPLNLNQLGEDCARFYADVFDYLNARRRPPNVAQIEIGNTDSIQKVWAEGVKYDSETRAQLVQRFSARAIALAQMLKSADIKPPEIWGFDHRAPEFAAHVGAIGELLKRGHLEEARRVKSANLGVIA